MIRINCPVCGLRDETEFTYGGDASVMRPPIGDEQLSSWMDFVFMRDNPRGEHREFWHHVQGCRQWLVLERNTANHAIGSCTLAAGRAE
jgi:sarcosine oxidase subunit delta